MLPLCRHFSRIHPNPLSRLHMPGSRARTEQEAAQQGHLTEQHLRWVSNSTAEHRLPGRSVPTPTASAHREPPRPEPQRPDPAMDPSGSLRLGNGLLVQTRGAPELLKASPTPAISSPHLFINQGWGQTPPLAAARAGTNTPSPLGARRWPRFSPTNLWRSAAGSTGALLR